MSQYVIKKTHITWIVFEFQGPEFQELIKKIYSRDDSKLIT